MTSEEFYLALCFDYGDHFEFLTTLMCVLNMRCCTILSTFLEITVYMYVYNFVTIKNVV